MDGQQRSIRVLVLHRSAQGVPSLSPALPASLCAPLLPHHHHRLFIPMVQPLTSLFSGSPHSLEFARQPVGAAQTENASLLHRAFLRLGGYYSRDSRLMRSADNLYACVTEQARDPGLAAAAQLPAGFQAEHAFLSLHVWLLLVRLRPEAADGRDLAQKVYDNFQDDVETRVRAAGVKVRLSKQLTELEKQFYGSSMAYDKALAGEGSAESLAAALQRNVYLGDAAMTEAAAALERYCKRELACLSLTPSEAVLAGHVKFSPLPGSAAVPAGAKPASSPAVGASPAVAAA